LKPIINYEKNELLWIRPLEFWARVCSINKWTVDRDFNAMKKVYKIVNRPIKAGEELFADYDYEENYPPPDDFPWYFELKRKIEQEEEERIQVSTLWNFLCHLSEKTSYPEKN